MTAPDRLITAPDNTANFAGNPRANLVGWLAHELRVHADLAQLDQLLFPGLPFVPLLDNELKIKKMNGSAPKTASLDSFYFTAYQPDEEQLAQLSQFGETNTLRHSALAVHLADRMGTQKRMIIKPCLLDENQNETKPAKAIIIGPGPHGSTLIASCQLSLVENGPFTQCVDKLDSLLLVTAANPSKNIPVHAVTMWPRYEDGALKTKYVRYNNEGEFEEGEGTFIDTELTDTCGLAVRFDGKNYIFPLPIRMIS